MLGPDLSGFPCPSVSLLENGAGKGRVSGLRDRGGDFTNRSVLDARLLAPILNLGGLERAGRVARVRHLGYMFIRQVPSPR